MKRSFVAVSALFLLLAACSSTPEDEVAGGVAGSGDSFGNGGAGSPTELGASGEVIIEEDVFSNAVPGTQEDFEINVGDRVFFGFDSSTLDDDARGTLDRQSAWLLQYPSIMVTIEGHTDERGTREYNLALGERRATAAKNYLVALGVDTNRMLTISYGEERPVDPGTDEAAFRQNRRAVTVVNLVN